MDVGRAFSAKPLPLALALGLLVLGGLALFGCIAGPALTLYRRAASSSEVGEFVPTGQGQAEFRVVDDVRPGHVGTVADERVDPIDVTATLSTLRSAATW